MAKLKPLLPTLRERKRYVVFEILSDKPISYFNKVKSAIETSLQSFVGSRGAGKAGLIFLPEHFDTKTQRGIVRVAHTSVDELKTAFAFVNDIEHQPVIIRSLGVSGILKKAINKYHME